ncbi:dynein light chain Tctex-type protein 2B-like [Ptychodera flava]|uniref:dynein light chain Tctex-type protein 2B-like n=1 Tax=Ptychodera flava TaxID=63121 RepID=UPI00396A0B07
MSERRPSVSSRRSSIQIESKDSQGIVVQTGASSADDTDSHGKGRPGIAAFRRFSRRTSIMGFPRSILRNKPKLENTYRMNPEGSQRFNASRVEKMLQSVLSSNLDDKVYDPKTATSLAANIADMAKHQAKIMGYERHKIVTHVVIGNITNQGIEICSRCLWDARNDDHASAFYKNSSLFAVATAYGVYFE